MQSTAHLTDDQWSEWLLGDESAGLGQHLSACPACRAEGERLRRMLGQFRRETHAAAARQEGFWHGQRTAIDERLQAGRPSRRLAWATAFAAILLSALLLTPKTSSPPPMADSDPDQDLLVDVARSLEREVPRALEPARLVTQDLARAASQNQ